MKEKENFIPLYVLNGFLKFDRKLYQIFNIKLTRPLRVKVVVYFFAFAGIEFVIYRLNKRENPLLQWWDESLYGTVSV